MTKTDDDEPSNFEPIAAATARILNRLRYLEMIEERLTHHRESNHDERHKDRAEHRDNKDQNERDARGVAKDINQMVTHHSPL